MITCSLHQQTNRQTKHMKEQNTKFTAAMTFNSDKVVIQEWRDRCDLGEKEMMRVLLRFAACNTEAVISEAQTYKDELQAEVAAIKAAALAEKLLLKQVAKLEREAKRLNNKTAETAVADEQAPAPVADEHLVRVGDEQLATVEDATEDAVEDATEDVVYTAEDGATEEVVQ